MSTLAGLVLITLALAYGVRVGSRAKAAGAGSRLSTTAAGRAIRDGVRRGRERAAGISVSWHTRGLPSPRRLASGAREAGGRYARRVSDHANGTRPSPAGRAWQRVLTGPAGTLPATVTRLPAAVPPDGNGPDPPDELAARRTRTPAATPPAPLRPAPPPAANEGTPPVATGAAEKAIEGIAQIHAEAAAGNIHAKHAAIKAMNEVQIRFAALAAMLARQLAEPGMHYGPEITEPLVQSATHLQAAAMASSESDSALTTLINTTVGDLARSARQAPHHTELAESAR